MNKNSYRLVPGTINYWGDILGNIEQQKDLVEYISSHGGGKAEWGSISGNISNQSDLMETLSAYALLSDIPSLEGYATEIWVSEQGYLTSIPSEYATESWVESQGYITSIPSEYATESWVESQGYLTSIPPEYATESWVNETLSSYALSTDIPSLEGYATQSWVESQGYLTSVPSGYATESFVTSTVSSAVDVITSDLSSYATKQWIQNAYGTRSWVSNNFVSQEAMSSYATQSWVESQGYLTSSALADGYAMKSDAELEPLYGRGSQTGYLKWSEGNEFGGYESWIYTGFASDNKGAGKVFNINGEVIGFNYATGEFYKYNNSTSAFEIFVHGTNYQDLTASPLWVDPLGRVCYGYSYFVDLDPDSPTCGSFSTWSHDTPDQWGNYAYNYYASNGSGQHNIMNIGSNTYLLFTSYRSAATAFMFDSTTSDFTIGVTYLGSYIYTLGRSCNYEGRFITTDTGGSMYELVEIYDDNSSLTAIQFEYVSESYFGTKINSKNINPVYMNKYTVGSSSFYAFIQGGSSGAAGVYLLSSDGTWETFSTFSFYSSAAATPAGCVVGSMAFGFGNDNTQSGYIPQFRFEASNFSSWIWDSTLESNVNSLDASVTTLEARISAIESSLDSALSITNNILS